MIYTIISIHKKKYKEHSKEAVFKIIDAFGQYKFTQYFSEFFYTSSKQGNFVYKEYETRKKINYDGYLATETKRIYSNAYYILLGEDGYPVNLNLLISDYNKSRKVKKVSNKTIKNRSTQKHRNSIKREGIDYPGIIKEYCNLLECQRFSIKIRKKRFKLFSNLYIARKFEDYNGRCYKDNKTWKNKKINKQWAKKAS